MRKSSKIVSLALSALMATSCFTGLTVCSASAADEETKVYFEVPTLESWGTTKSVFCHVYNVYGGSPLKETAWGSKSESCKKDAATGLYYFDTSKIGTIEDGADYALLFCTKDTSGSEHQTGNITLGKDCLGDTVYVTGDMVENTEDSTKMDFEGAWKNNSDKYGAKAAITSTGKIVGKYFPVYQPKAQIVSQFLCSWAVTNASIITPEIVQADCEELGVAPADVYAQYAADYAEKLADPENNPTVASLETIATLLGVDPSAETTEPETTEVVETEPETTEVVETEPETTEPVETEPETTEPATEPELPTILYGDVNRDGVVTVKDATLVQKIGLGMISDEATEDEATPDEATSDEATSDEPGQDLPNVPLRILADVNGDGRVSILDVTCIQKYLVVDGGYVNIGKTGKPIEIFG